MKDNKYEISDIIRKLYRELKELDEKRNQLLVEAFFKLLAFQEENIRELDKRVRILEPYHPDHLR